MDGDLDHGGGSDRLRHFLAPSLFASKEGGRRVRFLAFDSAFDRLVSRTEEVMRADLDFYSYYPMEDMIRWIGNRLNVSYQTAQKIFEDLRLQGIIEPRYGFYRLGRIKKKLLTRG